MMSENGYRELRKELAKSYWKRKAVGQKKTELR